MIAAASPRSSESDTPDSTVSGPRGDGYCLPTLAISSMGGLLGNRFIGPHRIGRRMPDRAAGAHRFRARPAERRGQFGIAAKPPNTGCERARVVGIDQQAASGLFDEFDKRAAA